jgi:hypothetical protein
MKTLTGAQLKKWNSKALDNGWEFSVEIDSDGKQATCVWLFDRVSWNTNKQYFQISDADRLHGWCSENGITCARASSEYEVPAWAYDVKF